MGCVRRPMVDPKSAVEALREALESVERYVQACGPPLTRHPVWVALDVLASLDELPTTEAIEKREDEEAARWQTRIAETIRAAGLEPIDASGNDSGDPLDWTDDQVRAALDAAYERGRAEERADVVARLHDPLATSCRDPDYAEHDRDLLEMAAADVKDGGHGGAAERAKGGR